MNELENEYKIKIEELKKDLVNKYKEKLKNEYKVKLIKLKEEYEEKVKEENFIKEGQKYFCISPDFEINQFTYLNDRTDKKYLKIGNIYPFTEENKEEVYKYVQLANERKKLKNQIDMFARKYNKEINWCDNKQKKWFLYIDYNNKEVEYDYEDSVENMNTVYFSSEKICLAALSKFKKEIEELYIKNL